MKISRKEILTSIIGSLIVFPIIFFLQNIFPSLLTWLQSMGIFFIDGLISWIVELSFDGHILSPSLMVFLFLLIGLNVTPIVMVIFIIRINNELELTSDLLVSETNPESEEPTQNPPDNLEQDEEEEHEYVTFLGNLLFNRPKLSLFLFIVFLSTSTFFVGASVISPDIITKDHEKRLELIRPYINNDTYIGLVSEWHLIKEYTDYQDYNNKVQDIINQEGLKYPKAPFMPNE